MIRVPYSIDPSASMDAISAMSLLLDRMADFLTTWQSIDARPPDNPPETNIVRTRDNFGNIYEIAGKHIGFPFRISYDDCCLYVDVNVLEWRDFNFGLELCQQQYLNRKESDTNPRAAGHTFVHFSWECIESDEELLDWEHADEQQRQAQVEMHRMAMGLSAQLPTRFEGHWDPPTKEAKARRKPRKKPL